MTLDGRQVSTEPEGAVRNCLVQIGFFSHPELVEPIAVSVSPQGQFVVVDQGLGICLFDQCGKLVREISEVSRLSSLQPNYLIFAGEGQL